MGEVATVGLDIAKSVFQVHGVDAEGQVVVQRRLTRAKLVPFFEKLPACRVGIETCATAHHWGCRLTELGHEVRLMPPSYVKPYVKRQKNDAADAEPSRHGARTGLGARNVRPRLRAPRRLNRRGALRFRFTTIFC